MTPDDTPPPASDSTGPAEVPEDPTITFDDFTKVELRTVRVLEAAPHPNADRLYLLQIDGGTEKRQIVAGVRGHYEAEDLVGRTIIVVWNLRPATIRGERSQGMMLAVQDGDTVSILSPDRPISPGCRVS